MHVFYKAITFLSLASAIIAAPTLSKKPSPPSHELPDGLPTPSPKQLKVIEQNAQGTLPNGPPPPVLSDNGIVNLQLIALNELFEVAFFNDLIANVTGNVTGYTFLNDKKRDRVLRDLKAILAQEELHAINANNALAHFKAEPIQPCKYTFPVQDFDSAIALAATFTDVVLGTLQDVIERFAQGGDFGLTRGVASVIGQEGEQLGWFRNLQNKIPSELPFLTTGDLNFAFSAIQTFVVPGSCPNIATIPLRTFEPLQIETAPCPKTQNLTFTFHAPPNETEHGLWMTFINQQNKPIVKPLHVQNRTGDSVTAKALFPYEEFEMNGLTIAAVTKSNGPFKNANAVANSTLAGPGLIIVN